MPTQPNIGKLNRGHTYGPIVPAGGDAVPCHYGPAVVGEVIDVKYRQRGVDVALHGVIWVISIRVHRERPVVHQPWNHVRCESNDHGLLRHQDIMLDKSRIY